jgi:tetratricopeptide (TPR) repeat protein
VIIEGRDTWMRLIEALRPDETHILHFIGHGTFDRMNGEGALVMEGDNGLSELIGSERLKILVRGRKHLRLVVLNSCLGTEASESEPFSSAAAALVRAGVPAVIAMQFEVSDDAAKKFAKTFYESLALNLPVDAALTEARRDIYLLNANTLEWATPVLFMQVPNGQLFDFSQSLPPPPADSLAKAAQPSLKKADGLGEGGIDLNQRAQAFYDKAYDAELQGDWETAIKAYQGALYAVPDFKDASVRWANCTRRQQCRDSYEQARRAYADERYAEALEILARIRTLDPSWVDQADIQILSDCGLKYRAALEALKLGNKNKGVELLRAIVTTRSTFKDASVRLDNILEGGDGLLGKTTLPPTPQPAKGRPSNPPRADGVLPFDDRVQADVQDTGDKSNELPSSARTYRWSSGNVEELVDHIRNWFVSKNYQVQVIGDANAYVVQGAKKSMVRGLLGTNAAASVTLQFSDDELRLHVGGGKWLDKAGAAATGIWITGGLTLVTGAYGLGVQKILLDDLWRACDVYLQSQGAKRLS